MKPAPKHRQDLTDTHFARSRRSIWAEKTRKMTPRQMQGKITTNWLIVRKRRSQELTLLRTASALIKKRLPERQAKALERALGYAPSEQEGRIVFQKKVLSKACKLIHATSPEVIEIFGKIKNHSAITKELLAEIYALSMLLIRKSIE